MKVTFPHIGKVYIPVRLLLESMGTQTAVPEINSAKTLEQGSRISPDEICLPFKLMAGNLTDGYKKGADTAVMVATGGPCRLGQYCQLLSDAMDGQKCSMNWIVLDSPAVIGKKEFMTRLKALKGSRNVSAAKTIRMVRKARKLMLRMDLLEEQCFFMAGYVRNPAELVALRRNLFKELGEAGSFKEAFRIMDCYEALTDRVRTRRKADPVRLALTGEIYTCIEPFANHNIEETLMNMGVSFQKTMTLSWWAGYTAKSALIKKKHSGYMPYAIGGYAHETVKAIDDYKSLGFDGIVQLMPAGCMPEIVAKTVFENNADGKNLEVLHLVFDEMTGDAGYLTRLESFADMLAARKRKGKK